MKSEEIEDLINDLLIMNYDAIQAYEHAVKKVKSPTFRAFLLSKISEHKNFVENLRLNASFHCNGKKLSKQDGFVGNIELSWMDMKTALSLNNDEAILKEYKTGDKANLKKYINVIETYKDLGKALIKIILVQKKKVENDLRQLQTLD